MKDRITAIRTAERESHEQAYTQTVLFEKGSWLAKPVKTVIEQLPLFDGYPSVRCLDLGCGVGRNAIPIVQYFENVPCRVDCVDILPMAIEKLEENAVRYGVSGGIRGVVSSIEDHAIPENQYDFILAVSALEHMESEEAFCRKLEQIHMGLRPGGVVCLIVNTEVRERDKETGELLPPQFEVNLPTVQMRDLLARRFGGWEILKQTLVPQRYDIPRGGRAVDLTTNVLTFVARKDKEKER